MSERRIFPRGRPTRFEVGQRVQIVGSAPVRLASITDVVITARHTRYRLNNSPSLYFESDLQETNRC